MKYILPLCFLLLCLRCFSQSYITLISQSYQEVHGGGRATTINKAILLTYSHDFCRFTIVGERTMSFGVVSYSKDVLDGGVMQESFLSAETSTTPFGYYDIRITRNKDGVGFIIEHSLASQYFAYYVAKADVYSPNGKVNNKVYMQNWKQYLAQTQAEDSLRRARNDSIAKQRDSLAKAELAEKIRLEHEAHIHDSIEAADEAERQDMVYANGNNVNTMVGKWLEDEVSSDVKTKPDGGNSQTFSGMIYDCKINIDTGGNIIKVTPTYSEAQDAAKYWPKIEAKLKSVKLSPFRGKNYKYYPSYATLQIVLYPAKN